MVILLNTCTVLYFCILLGRAVYQSEGIRKNARSMRNLAGKGAKKGIRLAKKLNGSFVLNDASRRRENPSPSNMPAETKTWRSPRTRPAGTNGGDVRNHATSNGDDCKQNHYVDPSESHFVPDLFSENHCAPSYSSVCNDDADSAWI
eukprot:Rmarinus@m.7893